MLNSKIELKNGKPTLYVNGEPTLPMAYTTYFEERSRYEDFVKSGYRIFFVNISFTTLPINTFTAFSPFRVGVFDDPEKENYSEFEDAVRRIIDTSPDAIIFPRINISMPRWWVDSHPDDVTPIAKGGYREALFSDAFRNDARDMLIKLIKHLKASDYAHRIGGWQICGGMTQEWFIFDYNGALCPAAEKQFKKYSKEVFGTVGASLPSLSDYDYKGNSYNKCENARRYSLFVNLGIAETIDFFAKTVKEQTSYEQVVGTFYGYSFESNQTVLFGSHALRSLIDSKNLDFFSSPNAYTDNRAFGIDWADMMPVDSLKLHGKLCFMECDIRTHLTRAIQDVRPGEYPDNIYRAENGVSVWVGPPTAELSVHAIRKSFAHQLTKGSAIWWFDMWGGWYDDPRLMSEIKKMKAIYEDTDIRATIKPEVVLFADERGYSRLLNRSPELSGIPKTRKAMGNTGVPFDCFMAEDAPAVLKDYKAAVFAMPIASKAGQEAMKLCHELGIPYLTATAEHPSLSVTEITEFYKSHGIHFYTNENDVVYFGNGYIGLHSKNAGKKNLKLTRPLSFKAVFEKKAEDGYGDVIEFELSENETALFELRDAVKEIFGGKHEKN